MYSVHEQSHVVHYIRRKEEGKEKRNEQTPTIYNSLEGLEKIYIMCTHSQLQQLRKIHCVHVRVHSLRFLVCLTLPTLP